MDEADLDLAVTELLEGVVQLVRDFGSHAREVPALAARACGYASRRVAADHQAAGVRLGDLEDVEVRRELDGHRAERGDRAVEQDEPGRETQVHAIDHPEDLTHDLERVDLLERRSVVAVEELAELGDELLLALLRITDAEIGEPPWQRLDVLVRDVDEEPCRLGDVLFR